MFLFLCLMAMLLVILLVAIPVIGATGGIGLIVFAEPIICLFIIGWLISRIFKK